MTLLERGLGVRISPEKEAEYCIKLAHSLDQADITAITAVTNGRSFYKEIDEEGKIPYVRIKYPHLKAEIALGVPLSDEIIAGYLKSGRQKFRLPLSQTAVIIKEKSVTLVCQPEVGEESLTPIITTIKIQPNKISIEKTVPEIGNSSEEDKIDPDVKKAIMMINGSSRSSS